MTTSLQRPLYELLVDELARAGVVVTFGLMGEDTARLVTDLDRVGIGYHGARHENVAVNMAAGYAWAAGDVGVCIVSRGPGLANAATALGTAAGDGAGIVVIAGDTATTGPAMADLKAKVDTAMLARAVDIECHAPVCGEDAVDMLRMAIGNARAGRPSLLALPVDMLATRLAPPPVTGPPDDDGGERAAASVPPMAQIDRVARMLMGAERPFILAGRGAVLADARAALEALAQRSGAPLGTSLAAKDFFKGSPREFGLVGGFTNDAGRDHLAAVDCMVVFGASLNPFTTAFGHLVPQASIVRFDRGPAGSHVPVALDIVADARSAAECLLDAIDAGGLPRRDAGLDVVRLRRSTMRELEDRSTPDAIDPRVLCRRLDELLPEDRSISTDTGYATTFAAAAVRVPHPSRFLLPQGLHAIGVGLGHALGAAVVRGSRHVLFVGDGALTMVLGDLATLAQYKLPLTVVVLNDEAYGAERHFLDVLGAPHHHASLFDPGFAGIAQAMGIEARTVRTIAELNELAPILSGPRESPLLLDCKIVPDIRMRWFEELG